MRTWNVPPTFASIGWYKEYRALGTRHEKLGVNYVALWLIAMIEKSLKLLFPNPS
jgi:hypothetical protein